MTQSQRFRQGADVNNLDLMNALARLGGTVEANFTTVFKRLDRHEAATTEILERVVRLEERPALPAEAPAMPPADKAGK